MSKSRGNGIALAATEDHTVAMIRRARTDSKRFITYDPAGRPAVAHLLDLLAAVTDEEPNRLADQIGDRGGEGLNGMLVDAINELLAPVRRRRAELADDASYLDDVLDAGNARAREIADKTLADVHEAIGMAYANRRRAVSTCSGRDVV